MDVDFTPPLPPAQDNLQPDDRTLHFFGLLPGMPPSESDLRRSHITDTGRTCTRTGLFLEHGTESHKVGMYGACHLESCSHCVWAEGPRMTEAAFGSKVGQTGAAMGLQSHIEGDEECFKGSKRI